MSDARVRVEPLDAIVDDEDIVATNESDSESSAVLRQFHCADEGRRTNRGGHATA